MDQKKSVYRVTLFSAVSPVIVVIVSLLLLQCSLHSTQVSADSGSGFGPACGQATIDGVVEEEWGTAVAQTFGLINPANNTPTLTATLRVMNSAHDLYLGFTINDDELSPQGNFCRVVIVFSFTLIMIVIVSCTS
jgi:hypothetical protein